MFGDACTELSQDMHEAALLSFSHVFGQVRATQELIEFLQSAKSQSAAVETSFLATS
jgi:isochorismate hydrolase